MVEELEAAQAKNKKKKNAEPIDRSKLNARLPDSIIFKLLKRRLNENICKNRGYILDGYPRTFNDALGVFCDIDENKAEDDPERFVLNNEILPNSIIRLDDAKDDFLKNRVKQIPELIQINPHYNEEGMIRRLSAYRTANESIKGDLSLSDFYSKKGVKIVGIDCKANIDEIFNKTKVFLERVCIIYLY
jgi:adenylate kinase